MQRFVGAIVLLLLVAPLHAGAQLGLELETVEIRLSPEYPRPYEKVTITVESTLVNLQTSNITISVNGAVVEEGTHTATIQAKGPGEKMTVRATVVASEGTFSAEKSFTPAEVSLLVEPVSTAHPFYEGALLVPSEGRVRVIALADLRVGGTRIATKDIAYTWRFGDKILTSDSGFGKSVLTATAPPRYRDAKISVTAETRDHTVVGYATATISPVDPIVRIYTNDPLRGTETATAVSGATQVASAEETFRVVSYFFSEPPKITWFLNGDERGAATDITIRTSGGSGSAALSVTAEGKDVSASESLSLTFGKPRSSGIFGF